MISKSKKVSLFLLRISLGWVMFYAGITKVINPEWSSEGFLNSAVTFKWLFSWLASPGILPIVNFLNQWGLTLVGISLIIGLFVKYGSISGAVLMFLYYLPRLDFPYPDANSFLIDSHIIYILAFIVLAAFNAGNYWGLDERLNKVDK